MANHYCAGTSFLEVKGQWYVLATSEVGKSEMMIPGGMNRDDLGETPRITLFREIKEETPYMIQTIRRLPVSERTDQGGHNKLFFLILSFTRTARLHHRKKRREEKKVILTRWVPVWEFWEHLAPAHRLPFRKILTAFADINAHFHEQFYDLCLKDLAPAKGRGD